MSPKGRHHCCAIKNLLGHSLSSILRIVGSPRDLTIPPANPFRRQVLATSDSPRRMQHDPSKIDSTWNQRSNAFSKALRSGLGPVLPSRAGIVRYRRDLAIPPPVSCTVRFETSDPPRQPRSDSTKRDCTWDKGSNDFVKAVLFH